MNVNAEVMFQLPTLRVMQLSDYRIMLCATTEVTRMSGLDCPPAPNNDTLVASDVANGNTPDAVDAAPAPAMMMKSGAAGNPCANDAEAFDANDAMVRTSINEPNRAILLRMV